MKASICVVVSAVIDRLAEGEGEVWTAVTPRRVAAKTENIRVLLKESKWRSGLVLYTGRHLQGPAEALPN